MGLFTDGFKELKKASEPLYKSPKSIQETIEIMAVAENGIFEVARNRYSKCYLFQDINYTITEIFLYKFLNDKFLYEVQQADEKLKESENVEQVLNDMSKEDYEMLLLLLPPATAKLKREHFISYLFNHKNDEKFHELFDSTLWDISNTNLDVFSVSTGSGDKIRLFDQNL